MYKNIKLRFLFITVTQLVSLVCFFKQVYASENQLENQLNEICASSMGENVNFQKAKIQCLKLLEANRVPKENGKIYAKLSEILSQDISLNAEEVKKYSKKALEYPLDTISTIQMYAYLGSSIEVLSKNSKPEQYASERLESAKAYLSGLNLVLKYAMIKKEQPLPVVGRFDYNGPPTDSVYQELVKKHGQEVENRNNIIFQNQLVRFLKVFTDNVTRLYTTKPYNNDELKQSLWKIIGSRSEADEILKNVRRINSDN